MRRAFTLIELLVVIAIIGLLIALFLPGISSSRRQARAAMGFANLRSLSQTLHHYAFEQRDAYVNPFRAAWPNSPEYSGMRWTTIHADSDIQRRWDFEAPLCPPAHTEGFSGVWYSFLAEYRGGKRNDPEQISPADSQLVVHYRESEGDQAVREGEVLMPTSYIYSPVFWSKPRRFLGHCRDDMAPELISTALQSAITYPSAKVLLFERGDIAGGRTGLQYNSQHANTHVALVDGSCERVSMRNLYDAAQRSPGLIATEACCPQPPPGPTLPFFYATHRGIQGRDLDR